MRRSILTWLAIMAFAVVSNAANGTGVKFRGANLQFLKYGGSECLLAGPADTGKSFVCAHKLHALSIKYPGSQSAILRQVQADMPGSILQTWEKAIRSALDSKAVYTFGGESAKFYQYWNGSRVWIGGMDRPGKVLSSERDFIYICQAEELTQDGYEHITTRCSGRANNAPIHQIMMDCNPGPPKHWLLQRVKAGFLKMFESRHEDNPTIFNEDGTLTPLGAERMRILDALTGVRYLRLRKGIWAGAEGIIYDEYDPAIHSIDRFDIPSDWLRYIVIDFGYTNPMVVQWWAKDGDGRLFRYREIYHTRRLVEDVARQARDLSINEKIEDIICDHDAEDRATWERHFGQYTTPANKDVIPGIQCVQSRLRKAGDGRPRIAFLKDSRVELDNELVSAGFPTCTEDEFEEYVWKDNSKKEEPKKEKDHGMDTTRYMCATIDNPSEVVLRIG